MNAMRALSPIQWQELRPVPDEHVAAVTREDETVLLDVARGHYFVVSGAGGTIWAAICEGLTIAGLIDAVLAEFAVSRSDAERDTLAFLDRLCELSLVSVAEGS